MNYLLATLFILSLLFTRLDRYFFKLNESFCPNFILPKWSNCPQLETNNTHFLPSCINQPFTYWTKGKQSFVFLSKDKNWVLKFIRLPKSVRRNSFKRTPSSFLLATFHGYKWANDSLSKQTGVIYAHLKPTQYLHKQVELIDLLGNHYQIALDETPFIIQKVAKPFYETFTFLSSANAKILISQTIDLYAQLYEKGFIDRDPIFDKNLAISEQGPIIIDIGQIERCTSLPEKQEYLSQMTQSLSGKLQREFPELFAYYKKLLQ